MYNYRYYYSYSYKDLLVGSVVEQDVSSSEKLSLDDLFLGMFVFLIEVIYPSPFCGYVEYEGFSSSISGLRGKSAIDFKKMKFKMISGQENLKRSRIPVENFRE